MTFDQIHLLRLEQRLFEQLWLAEEVYDPLVKDKRVAWAKVYAKCIKEGLI